MHEPITGYLEEILSGARIPEAEGHLRDCAECRREIALMTQHATLLRAMRAPADAAEPAAGFYGRVMNRVETQIRPSIWALFGESLFAKRLSYASLAAALLLSAAFLANPPGEVLAPGSSPEVIIASAAEQETVEPLGADQQRDREAILVQLATYSD